MLDTAFSNPVTVMVGMGFPRKISSLMDAIRYLDDQPSIVRDEAFQVTYAACRGVLAQENTSQEAYDLFCALARRRGVLVEEVFAEPASAASQSAVPLQH